MREAEVRPFHIITPFKSKSDTEKQTTGSPHQATGSFLSLHSFFLISTLRLEGKRKYEICLIFPPNDCLKTG